ncbi:MAG: hypothetical protein ABI779_06800 [Acidobacteriota bacterium]
MPENLNEQVPAAALTSTHLSNTQKWLVLGLSLIFALLPLFFIGDLSLQGFRLSDLDASGFFLPLGLLPGLIGFVYHLFLANARRSQGRAKLAEYYAWRSTRSSVRAQDRATVVVDEVDADPLGALAACLLLTGIFLLIAVFAGYEAAAQHGAAANGVQGMMYAGLGAYVAVLYYMVARLYANALSSRFLMTSALRTASAVVLGWVFGIVGVTAFAGVPSNAAAPVEGDTLAANAVLFLAGLFHNMAIDALRSRARRLFGSSATDAAELPLTGVEGIDDTTAELLTEHGVATIQHLATSEPGELCDRTLLPMERVVDWMDQALLIRYLKANITVARGLGIRAATDLALVHMRGDTSLLGSLAEKTGLPPAAIDHIARELRDDYIVALLYEIEQGRPFPAATAGDGAGTASTAATQATASPSPMIQISQQPASAATLQT